MDDLGNTFDVVVVGTGMPECILAAAVARIGKSVLHLDRNGHYGGNWASFNFDQFLTYFDVQSSLPQSPSERMMEAAWLEQLNDDERLILCPKHVAILSDIVHKTFIKDKRIVQEEKEVECSLPCAMDSQPCTSTNISETHLDELRSEQTSEVLVQNIPSHEVPVQVESSHEVPNQDESSHEVSVQDESLREGPVQDELVHEVIVQDESVHEVPVDASSHEVPVQSVSSHDVILQADSSSEIPINVETVSDTPIQTEASEVQSESSNVPRASQNSCDQQNENVATASASGDSQMASTSNPVEVSKPEWTMEDLKENRRKFNLDLSPKLLFSRGSLVELLITSNIARYAEFQCITRVLTLIDGRLEQVPCSRADVFSTKNVSVVEKRMLMKLLTFCMEFQKFPEEYRGYEGRPYLEFLRSRKVTSNIEHYVLHAIAMVDESCPTLQGLTATQKFMESLGRYGNSPFLWSCFGSAELPQCFCRLCAVFGGIYHLQRDADAVILDQEEKCVGLVTAGKKISCQVLIMESSYAPLRYVPTSTTQVSRAIYITDSTILPAERQQNTLLRLPPIKGVCNVITVLEFGALSYICPDNLFVVHMTCHSLHQSVEDDFKSAEENLFSNESEVVENESKIPKPKILWCTYFRQKDTTSIDINAKVPQNLFLTSSADSELDYEHAVIQAREIFEKLYPGEEFLPRAPDPEDIVMDECSNPGEKDGYHEDDPELRNIENDVKTDEESSEITDKNRETLKTDEESDDMADKQETLKVDEESGEMTDKNREANQQNEEKETKE